jgi:hypothetical protein
MILYNKKLPELRGLFCFNRVGIKNLKQTSRRRYIISKYCCNFGV